MNKTLILAVLGAATVATILVAGMAAQPAAPPIKEFMTQKLEYSKRVLEGLAIDDLALVDKYARRLGAMSQEASWRTMNVPEYVRHSETFRRNADDLAKAAMAGNLDGATLAYVKLTMSCVECHKFVRGKKMAALD